MLPSKFTAESFKARLKYCTNPGRSQCIHQPNKMKGKPSTPPPRQSPPGRGHFSMRSIHPDTHVDTSLCAYVLYSTLHSAVYKQGKYIIYMYGAG